MDFTESMYNKQHSIDPSVWDDFVARHADGHILQTSSWGALKSQFGWADERVGLAGNGDLVAGAQILIRRLPAGLGHLAYVPKGPLTDWDDEAQVRALLALLDRTARSRGAIALMIEPDLPDEIAHCERLRALGFRPSPFDAIQPRRTLVVDISADEETILKAFKSKTRYNVRLAARKGVTVREADKVDLPAFHTLMAATAARDRFGVHTPAYYEEAYRLFVPRNWARLLLAEVEGEPVAALMVFALPPRAWYLVGASGDVHREKMPAYSLQWGRHVGPDRWAARLMIYTVSRTRTQRRWRPSSPSDEMACGVSIASSGALAGGWCAAWGRGIGSTRRCGIACTGGCWALGIGCWR
jgi:peptidoglycan pentaglycine glycine transferase (the first glycine)